MVPVFAAILRVPFGIIAPIILVICAIGAYTVAQQHLRRGDDAGVRHYRLLPQKCNYPLAPLVLAIVLGRQGGRSRSASPC